MGPSEREPAAQPSDPGRQNPGEHDGYAALSYLIAGVGIYGGLGWLLDSWLGTRFCLPIGLVLGAGLGTYLIVRRFGRSALHGDD